MTKQHYFALLILAVSILAGIEYGFAAALALAALMSSAMLGPLSSHRCGLVTLVNLTGFQRGVEVNETGINVETFECRYFPEWKEKLPDLVNQSRGFSVPDELSREITIQGEISGTTGLMAATHVAAVSVANDVADFDATGTIFMDEATVAQGRAAWRNLNMKLSSDPGILLA